MKKRVLILVMALVLLCTQAVFAQETYARVFDYAGLFTGAEAEELEAAIIDFQEATGYDFAILVSDADYGYDDYQLLCDDFYVSQNLGLGMNNTALLCYLDLSGDGYYYVSAYGDLKNLMVDEEIMYLAETAMEYFYNGDFEGGFTWTIHFLSQVLTEIGKANETWRVFDFAEMLTETEAEELEAAIAEFRALSGYDFVYLSTYDEMTDNEGGDYMEEFYGSHGFGSGDAYSGAMIYLDLYYGNYYVQNFGDMDDVVSRSDLSSIVNNANALMGEGMILSAVLQILDDYTAYFK